MTLRQRSDEIGCRVLTRTAECRIMEIFYILFVRVTLKHITVLSG